MSSGEVPPPSGGSTDGFPPPSGAPTDGFPPPSEASTDGLPPPSGASTDGLPPRSPLGMIVLFMLYEGPTHPYRMQKLIESRGKGRVVNVGARASLYQTIRRLLRLGLVEVAETLRSERYPDRVVYAITERGREVAQIWLQQMLSTTEGEYPEFIAAVSVLFGLAPEEARAALELRAERRAAELADCEASVRVAPPELPRLFLLEEEYRAAMLRAELAWLHGVIDDLRAGRLDWSEAWLREIAEAFAS